MTNPGGMKPPWRTNEFAPTFPRYHLQPVDDPQRSRDLQVWPRTMRETADRHELHRTAGVKHHLRAMAGRDEMLTTYEHDFAVMSRPNPMGRSASFGSSNYHKGSTAHRDMMRSASSSSPARISVPKPWQDDNDEIRSMRSGKLGSRERDLSGTLGHSTMSKMHSMKSSSEPMRLTINGWGDQRWCPKTYPSMVLGMSAKRIDLVQAANLMNLRAPDLPFSTR